MYVERDTYNLLVDATNSNQIRQQTTHRYIPRVQHIERIKKEKAAEVKRREMILAEQKELTKQKLEEEKLNALL